MDRIILDLCGGTGAWSKPYKDAGYDVRNITLPKQDVRLFQYPGEQIHGVLCAPPCTHFSRSGARWWKQKGEGALIEALTVVDACLRIVTVTEPEWWCLENPIGRLIHFLGPWAMTFNPCDYGDPYTKRTCLWGKFNHPVKRPVFPLLGGAMHILPPSKDRAMLRSVTPSGFARAFFEANP